MKFYFDENASFRLVDALNSIVHGVPYEIVHTARDMGWGGLSDLEWIGKLPAKEECFIVTKDLRQKTRALERAAWKRAQAVVFFYPRMWIHSIGTDQAWKFMRWWTEIERTAIHSEKGLCYRIPYRSKPSRLIPWED